MNILIVDDKDENLYSLESYIKDNIESINIYKTNSGESALSIAYEESINLILLDVQLPIFDGFEVAKYLQLNPKTSDIPIIFITAHFEAEEFVKKGFDLGAIDYLTKPLEKTKLLNQIRLYTKIVANEKKIKQEYDKRQKERIKIYESKMTTMSEMMSNIAHQWRQPLTAIISSVDYIELMHSMKSISDKELSHELNNVSEIALFLSNTITTFQNFFRTDRVASKFSLKDTIDEVLLIVGKTLENSEIQIVLKVDDMVLNGYKNELEQAILNIINNANDVLVNSSIKNRLIFIKTSKKDDMIMIDIYDNGGGIEPKILSKVFEPYFTTKHQSQGTGIGLYMTYQIIVDHFKGDIKASNIVYEYNSVEYSGAKFCIEIPTDIDSF
jgi:signal transduction histidine kinase